MDTGPKQKRKTNPRTKANLFSILTFGWTLEIFKLGYTRDIRERDLYAPLPEHRSILLGDAVQNAWNNEVTRAEKSNNNKPSLWMVIIKVFGCQYMLYGLILAAMELIIRLQQPLFLGKLLRYYSPAQGTYSNTTQRTYMNRIINYYAADGPVSWGEAVFFCFGVVFCSCVNVLVQHPFLMGVMHIGMKIRVGVCSLIYRKALKVSIQAMTEKSAGQVMNLMATDVNRFDNGTIFLHYLWIGPLETMFMTIFLYREMGIAAIYGVLTIIFFIPFQIFLGIQTARYRRGTAIKSDERVRLMNEIILGIDVIKIYTWEEPFRKIIDTARRKEIYYIKMTSYIRGIILSFIMFTSRFGIFITVLFYVLLVDRVTVEKVFFITCYYNITKQTMTLYFPQAVGQLAEMNVAVQRIRDYLLSEECQLFLNQSNSSKAREGFKKKVTIMVHPKEAQRLNSLKSNQPSTSQSSPTLIVKTDQNVEQKANIIIDIDNAKSRWFKSSDKNDITDISVKIPSGSLTTVIGAVGAGKSTLLHVMLGELPCSDGYVNINGTMSYASQEPWLFLGTVRQNILFGQTFNKVRYMEVCKVCALERDLSLFPHGDKTIVGERGVSLSGGQRARINLARAVYKKADIYILDDPLSAVDTQVAKHIFERCIKSYLENNTVILVTHQIQFIKNVDQIIVMDRGTILGQGTYAALKSSQLNIMKMMEDKAKESQVKDEEQISDSAKNALNQPSAMNLLQRRLSLIFDSCLADEEPYREWQALGRVQGSAYNEYLFAGGGACIVILIGFMFVLAQFSASAGDYWLSRWSRTEEELTGDNTMDAIIWSEQDFQREHYILIFGVITIGTIAVALIRAVLFFSHCMRSSIKLHDKMFECVARSPMSFFHTNPSGRILNRFSKDMGAIDEFLPQAMIDCIQIMLNMVGVVTVIILVDVTLLIPITAAIIIFYIFRIVYIRTTGAIKRLEGITRSPVFGHLNATVMGLATIRTFGAEELLAAEFDSHQDLHSSSWYLFITCSRAFGYFLDVICLMFIICVTFGCLIRSDAEGSNVGLAITQSISLTGIFQWGMRQSAEMENQMTSVERVLEYTKLAQEPELRCAPELAPPSDWPMQGGIEFVNLCVQYMPNGNRILNKLCFVIEPQQKIGIVGRTGAGKTSVIQALFRLAYLDGSIFIDGVDITKIGLHDLREKISIIPQKPVLFSGTMRKNLDPFDEYSDDMLLTALEAVELKSAGDGGATLNRQISEGGSNFSVGERQLVCLARAIIRNNKILVLDEATANVDTQTDALIQRTIREHFQTCTVLTIAHRLNTIIDSDKIMVLDAGHLVEYDHPYVLLKNRKGYFSQMVAETGPQMSSILIKLAVENYNQRKEVQTGN